MSEIRTRNKLQNNTNSNNNNKNLSNLNPAILNSGSQYVDLLNNSYPNANIMANYGQIGSIQQSPRNFGVKKYSGASESNENSRGRTRTLSSSLHQIFKQLDPKHKQSETTHKSHSKLHQTEEIRNNNMQPSNDFDDVLDANDSDIDSYLDNDAAYESERDRVGELIVTDAAKAANEEKIAANIFKMGNNASMSHASTSYERYIDAETMATLRNNIENRRNNRQIGRQKQRGAKNGKVSKLLHLFYRMPYDKHFRMTCVLVSVVIILQAFLISPKILTNTHRIIMLISVLINICVMLAITWSRSFFVCWKFQNSLRSHLHMPQLFLVSYLLGYIMSALCAVYLVFRIYYLSLSSTNYDTQTSNEERENCSFYECFNSMIWLASWWPLSVCINNEHARFLDRYRSDSDETSLELNELNSMWHMAVDSNSFMHSKFFSKRQYLMPSKRKLQGMFV